MKTEEMRELAANRDGARPWEGCGHDREATELIRELWKMTAEVCERLERLRPRGLLDEDQFSAGFRESSAGREAEALPEVGSKWRSPEESDEAKKGPMVVA